MSSQPSGLFTFASPQSSGSQQQQQQPKDENLVLPRNSMFGGSSQKTTSNSNRSSMDYNTLIIHSDDSGGGTSNIYNKYDRPRSFGTDQVIKEILESSDDYNQSSVLKQLVKEMKKEMKLPARNVVVPETECPRPPPKYNEPPVDSISDDDEEEDGSGGVSKLKSKSQPDLSRIIDIDLDTIEALMRDNVLLKQQLHTCYKKVAKTKKLEDEVANIYRVHDELTQSCERREKLERAARARLQTDLQRYQEMNKNLKEEVDLLQSQLLAPSEHQMIIAQLFQQNKELTAAKERQEIELAAQRATLQEQRKHIGILDKALQNAQHNSRCLEEELRKKQSFQLQPHSEALSKESRSGSSTNSADTKWIAEQTSQLMSRMDIIDSSKLEQRRLDEISYRQNLAKSMEKTSMESNRMLSEARQDKARYLDELHSAQKKVCELQNHLKDLEGHVEEKDALIRALQVPKGCGSSFDSYHHHLSMDSYGLRPLVANQNASQASFNVSNASFNTNMDQNCGQSNRHMSSSSSSLLPNAGMVGSANYPAAYIRSGDVVGANFIASKMAANSPSSSPSLNYTLQGVHHRMPGGYENRALTVEPPSSSYNSLLDSNERAQLMMTRKSLEDHLMKMNKGLCCFPRLSTKKQQSLLANEANCLSNGSDDGPSKSDEMIVLLEKQGRSSQKMRPGALNLMQVSQLANQRPRLEDISTIGTNRSLPSPRNLKPPTRLSSQSDAEMKRQQGLVSVTNMNYKRLEESNPAKKRSLLPKRTMASPSRHANFILGGTPTPTQQQQQGQVNKKSASLDRDRQESPRKMLSSRSSVPRNINGENRYRIQF